MIDVPFLMVGGGLDGGALLAVQQGADNFLESSTGPKELVARIESLLGRHLLVRVGDGLGARCRSGRNWLGVKAAPAARHLPINWLKVRTEGAGSQR